MIKYKPIPNAVNVDDIQEIIETNKRVEQENIKLNNIINEFDKISYEDWNMWGKYREYIKILSEFADDTQSKLNPYLTDVYKSDIKVAIKVLIRVLKESYTKDKIEELESQLQQKENIIKEVREYIKENILAYEYVDQIKHYYNIIKIRPSLLCKLYYLINLIVLI